jgi:hypothetical protein
MCLMQLLFLPACLSAIESAAAAQAAGSAAASATAALHCFVPEVSRYVAAAIALPSCSG